MAPQRFQISGELKRILFASRMLQNFSHTSTLLSADTRLRLPQPEHTLVRPCRDEIPVRVVRDADRALVRDLEQILELPGLAAEAIQRAIFAEAVDPLASRRHPARHELTAFPLTRLERLHNLRHQQLQSGITLVRRPQQPQSEAVQS